MTTNGKTTPTLAERRADTLKQYDIAKAQVEAFYTAQLRLLDELIAAETPKTVDPPDAPPPTPAEQH